jgi:hypothetical protein
MSQSGRLYFDYTDIFGGHERELFVNVLLDNGRVDNKPVEDVVHSVKVQYSAAWDWRLVYSQN